MSETEIRTEHYYGGTLVLRADHDEFTPASLVWDSYGHHGSSTISLSWEEVERLHAALGELLTVKPDWI